MLASVSVGESVSTHERVFSFSLALTLALALE
jgi:hypothetical protein